jgi:hypothetical protein
MRALKAALCLCVRQLQELEPDEQDAEVAGFGSVEGMRKQLETWGAPGWMTRELPKSQAPDHASQRQTARGYGAARDMPPAANATSIFEGAIEKLSVFVQLLPSRREQRQGGRFVVSYAKPLSEPLGPGENRVYIEAPADAKPDKHGNVSYTLAEANLRVAGGAARYPDDSLTAAIAAALLTGATTDELLDALHEEPTQEVRERARELAGEQEPPHRHSLKHRARQLAALVRGYPVGKGKRDNSASKEWHSAAWAVQERLGYGYSEREIVRWLNEQDAVLPELKKSRKVTVQDVRDLRSLDFEPYPDFKTLLTRKV